MDYSEMKTRLEMRDSHHYNVPEEVYIHFLEETSEVWTAWMNQRLKPYEAFEIIMDLASYVLAKRLSGHYQKKIVDYREKKYKEYKEEVKRNVKFNI